MQVRVWELSRRVQSGPAGRHDASSRLSQVWPFLSVHGKRTSGAQVAVVITERALPASERECSGGKTSRTPAPKENSVRAPAGQRTGPGFQDATGPDAQGRGARRRRFRTGSLGAGLVRTPIDGGSQARFGARFVSLAAWLRHRWLCRVRRGRVRGGWRNANVAAPQGIAGVCFPQQNATAARCCQLTNPRRGTDEAPAAAGGNPGPVLLWYRRGGYMGTWSSLASDDRKLGRMPAASSLR